MEPVDWKRNNKVGLREFSESSDFHDIVKTVLVRMLRRKHPKSDKTPIYTEHNPLKPNEDYPDIWAKIDGEVITWEIQKEMTKDWMAKVRNKDVDVIVVPLDQLNKDIEIIMKGKDLNFLNALRKSLEPYTI